MNRLICRIAALLSLLVLGISAAGGVLAAAEEVTFLGRSRGFDMGTGSEYSATDLFPGLKAVMPGDSLSDTVTIRNRATDCAYIKVSLKISPHDDKWNLPAYTEPAGEPKETPASMEDFLSQLTMRIYNGYTLIYEAAPADPGALASGVRLGTLERGDCLVLRIELDVPSSLDNRYMHRIGEMDWVLTAECFEEDVKLPQTGQVTWPVWLLTAGGAMLLAFGIHQMIPNRKHNEEIS